MTTIGRIIGAALVAMMVAASAQAAAGDVAAKKRQAAEVKKAAQGRACPCGTALVCIGPRGGRYCQTPAGARRYL